MYPTISAQDGLSVCTSHYAFMVSQSLSEALVYWFAFLFVEKVHKTSGLTRSWKKNTFSKGLKMTPFSACFWLSPTFLLFYGVQGNFFVKTSFKPDLNDLWIHSKTLKRPGASESTAVECQVECNQLPGCEFARVQGNECQLGTLTKWEHLTATPLGLQRSNEEVFVTQGKPTEEASFSDYLGVDYRGGRAWFDVQ